MHRGERYAELPAQPWIALVVQSLTVVQTPDPEGVRHLKQGGLIGGEEFGLDAWPNLLEGVVEIANGVAQVVFRAARLEATVAASMRSTELSFAGWHRRRKKRLVADV